MHWASVPVAAVAEDGHALCLEHDVGPAAETSDGSEVLAEPKPAAVQLRPQGELWAGVG